MKMASPHFVSLLDRAESPLPAPFQTWFLPFSCQFVFITQTMLLRTELRQVVLILQGLSPSDRAFENDCTSGDLKPGARHLHFHMEQGLTFATYAASPD
jgi:hypothetical protein